MLFPPEHVEMIKKGLKTQSRRKWIRRMVKRDVIYKVKTQLLSNSYHCKIRVLDVRLERLGDMTDLDAMKTGGCTLEEYKRVWSAKNGEWDPDLLVHVVDFQLVKEELLTY